MKTTLQRRYLCVACIIFAFLTSARHSEAATRTVTSANDSGPGSLRQAILDASPGDTINFAAGITTINLTSSELLINTNNLTINAPGPNVLTVQRSSGTNFRIFNISDASITVTISGLTIADGLASNYYDNYGGGISNVGALTISNCIIHGNSASQGFDPGKGGGIYNNGLMSIIDCTISDNAATVGGGLWNQGRMTITNSTISQNSTPFGGGGITNYVGSSLTITSSTISGNSVAYPKGAAGGGIDNAGMLTITSTTISGNSATGSQAYSRGGGIESESSGTVTARNTIVALNTAPNGPDVDGALTSQNFNLIGNNAGATITPQPADQIGNPGAPIDPLLGPLQNNGGPTETLGLLSGSPAIDKGNSSGLSADQRGFHRPVDLPSIPNAVGGDGSDIGAFEFDSFAATGNRFDFNGDGKTDYVLYNASTRQTSVWYLNNNAYVGGGYGPTLGTGWVVATVADFNGDGKPDYALFNASTRRTAIWYLNNRAYLSGAYGPTLPSGWELAAVGDFNGDGKPDYVLYNTSTRQTVIWYLNNNAFVSSAYGPTIASGYVLVGVVDFNRNGKLDYLLFNPSTRRSVIWYMNNNVFVSGAYGPTITSGYVLAGTADFNGDGKPDYVLYNSSTRRTVIWYLNNNTYVSGAYGPALPSGWSLGAP